MPLQAQETIRELALLLDQERYCEIATAFDYPLAVHVEQALLVLRTPAELSDMLRMHHTALRAIGLTSVVMRVMAVELPRQGRFRVWTESDHVVVQGARQGTWKGASSAIVYCRHLPGGGMKIEMVDFSRLAIAMPLLGDEEPQRAETSRH